MNNSSSAFLRIEEYPNAIANAQLKILSWSEELEAYRKRQNEIVDHIDKMVACDNELKNVIQGKEAKLKSLERNDKYKLYNQEVNRYSHLLESGKIKLEKLRNEFSVLKLNAQERIAFLESQSICYGQPNSRT